MIKSFGGRCDLLNGRGEVKLRWYASLGEMSRKMQKNFYAITGRFSIVRILAQVALLLWLGLFPLVLLAAPSAPSVAGLVGLALGSHAVNAVVAAVWLRRPVMPALFAPLGFVLLAMLVLRAGIIGHHQAGITWRGVLYPTSLLRAHQRVKV
jgi:predicted dienelactone hydrolase